MSMKNEDHPMFIYNARARHAADQAENEMNRELAKEIDGPRPGIFDLLKKALESDAK